MSSPLPNWVLSMAYEDTDETIQPYINVGDGAALPCGVTHGQPTYCSQTLPCSSSYGGPLGEALSGFGFTEPISGSATTSSPLPWEAMENVFFDDLREILSEPQPQPTMENVFFDDLREILSEPQPQPTMEIVQELSEYSEKKKLFESDDGQKCQSKSSSSKMNLVQELSHRDSGKKNEIEVIPKRLRSKKQDNLDQNKRMCSLELCQKCQTQIEAVQKQSEAKEQDNYDQQKRKRSAELHNLSERRRRGRISEKIKILQQRIPNCGKTDRASILEGVIQHINGLKRQIQYRNYMFMMRMMRGDFSFPSSDMTPEGLQGVPNLQHIYDPTMPMSGLEMGMSGTAQPFE